MNCRKEKQERGENEKTCEGLKLGEGEESYDFMLRLSIQLNQGQELCEDRCLEVSNKIKTRAQ